MDFLSINQSPEVYIDLGSPKWAKGQEGAIMCVFLSTAIKQLWGEGDHQAEIEDIKREKAAMSCTKSLRVLEVLKTQSLRWQLYVMITVMSTLQLCGINAVESLLKEIHTTAAALCHYWQRVTQPVAQSITKPRFARS